jgi:hypothetical protein
MTTFDATTALTLAAEAEESLDANASGNWPTPAPDLRKLASMLRAAVADLAQRVKDWDALVKLIAETVGDKEDREAAEMDELGEFDPWHALRTHASDRDSLRAKLAEVGLERESLIREGFELAVETAVVCHESECNHDQFAAHINWTEARRELEARIAEVKP